jgi:nucleoside-diphosphate-sugar epimerase
LPIEHVEKKIMVTGGAGFIGSKLVRALLERGAKVKVLDCQYGPFDRKDNPNLEFAGIGSDESHAGMANRDVVQQAVRDVDVVYHLAINWDGHTWKHQLPLADLFDLNVRGTLNLLEAAKSHGVRHFLYSSSCAVYGTQGSQIVDEENVCKPELWNGDPGPAYGILKLTIEKLCSLYYRQYGLPTTSFRIDFVFDENNALPTQGIIDNLREGKTIEVKEGDGYASIHVDEVVQAFLLATLNKRTYGQIFNLSNPSTFITYYELYQLLIKNTNSKSKVRLSAGQEHEGRAIESIEKIQNALGWRPSKTQKDLKQAIIQNIKSG